MSFEAIKTAPPDAILGLTEAFERDPNPQKINLSPGVYRDSTGRTPIMRCVKEAEARILREESTKEYLGIQGSQEYGRAVGELVFGPRNPLLAEARLATVQTPGGTAALRMAADFIKKSFPNANVWLSDPTWPNHPTIFQAVGLGVRSYPYFDPATNSLKFERMHAALQDVPAGDVVLLHACCHNPTGIDPSGEQWARLAEIVAKRRFLPLIDFAYQGLAEGIREDAAAVELLSRTGCELLVANSFSKNFGIYSERVGALSAVCETSPSASAVLSQLKACARANYSNPPAHGAEIVVAILTDPALRAAWEEEVKAIRDRINGMRHLFVRTLAVHGVTRDFSFIARQRGMFSFSGLTPAQVQRLREEFSIYVVGSGRMNVAGMTEANINPLCAAIAAVLRN